MYEAVSLVFDAVGPLLVTEKKSHAIHGALVSLITLNGPELAVYQVRNLVIVGCVIRNLHVGRYDDLQLRVSIWSDHPTNLGVCVALDDVAVLGGRSSPTSPGRRAHGAEPSVNGEESAVWHGWKPATEKRQRPVWQRFARRIDLPNGDILLVCASLVRQFWRPLRFCKHTIDSTMLWGKALFVGSSLMLPAVHINDHPVVCMDDTTDGLSLLILSRPSETPQGECISSCAIDYGFDDTFGGTSVEEGSEQGVGEQSTMESELMRHAMGARYGQFGVETVCDDGVIMYGNRLTFLSGKLPAAIHKLKPLGPFSAAVVHSTLPHKSILDVLQPSHNHFIGFEGTDYSIRPTDHESVVHALHTSRDVRERFSMFTCVSENGTRFHSGSWTDFLRMVEGV